MTGTPVSGSGDERVVRSLEEPDGPWDQVLVPTEGGGWIGLASPRALAEARSVSLHRRVLRLTIPIGAMGLGLGLLWVLRVKRAIREVTGFVSSLDRGVTGRRLPVRGPGAIGELSRAVNRMAWEVESHDQAVSRSGQIIDQVRKSQRILARR